MSKNRLFILSVSVLLLTLEGCNAGMQPTGPTPEEARAKIAAMPPDQQISMLEHSPVPKAEKERQIKQIRDKYHLPEPPATSGEASNQVNGVPPSTTGQ